MLPGSAETLRFTDATLNGILAGAWDWQKFSVNPLSAPPQSISTSSVGGDITPPRPTAALGEPDVPQHSPAGISSGLVSHSLGSG